jgi:hypothetical protein
LTISQLFSGLKILSFVGDTQIKGQSRDPALNVCCWLAFHILKIPFKSLITAEHRPYAIVEDLKFVEHCANVNGNIIGAVAIVLIGSTGPVSRFPLTSIIFKWMPIREGWV